MWKIGDLRIDGRVVLGPMSGFTSRGYRDFMKQFGVAVSVTEMTSDRAIIHNPENNSEYIAFDRNYPTGLQLFGSDPEIMAEAARIALKVNPNIDFFDVNMGCPVPKISRSGSGAVLMKDPKRCGEIVRRIKSAVDVPVTAKIRLGWDADSMNFREVIGELESADVDAISLHARTKEERYIGTPHYDLLEGLRSEMSVPLIISGNIFTAGDAVRAAGITGAEAVMVARGGVGNPFLVSQINHCFETGEILPNPTISQQIDWCMELTDMIVEEKGEDVGIRKMRCFAPKFIAGCHRSREYRFRLAFELTDRPSLDSILEEIRSKMGDERIYLNVPPVRKCSDEGV